MATKFEDVLQEEKEKIGKKEKLIGLAFSGGGIRSATFNLGIIQALAKKKLLNKFDYLSTVSGGSYIGSWLTSWAYREQQNTPYNIEQRNGIEHVQDKLNDKTDPMENKAEPREISWLRQYSNYLTPRKGLFSLDTLTDLTYHFRNVFLSSVVIGLFVFGIMSLFAGVMLLIEKYQHQSIAGIELSQIALILDLAFGFFAAAIVWFRLPLVAGVLKSQSNKTFFDKKFNVKIIAILATIFSICLGIWGTQITANAPLLWGIVLSSTYACAAWIGIAIAKHHRQKIDTKVNWVWLHWCAVLGAIPILALGYVLPHISDWIHEILFGISIAEKQSYSVWFLVGIISPTQYHCL